MIRGAETHFIAADYLICCHLGCQHHTAPACDRHRCIDDLIFKYWNNPKSIKRLKMKTKSCFVCLTLNWWMGCNKRFCRFETLLAFISTPESEKSWLYIYLYERPPHNFSTKLQPLKHMILFLMCTKLTHARVLAELQIWGSDF